MTTALAAAWYLAEVYTRGARAVGPYFEIVLLVTIGANAVLGIWVVLTLLGIKRRAAEARQWDASAVLAERAHQRTTTEPATIYLGSDAYMYEHKEFMFDCRTYLQAYTLATNFPCTCGKFNLCRFERDIGKRDEGRPAPWISTALSGETVFSHYAGGGPLSPWLCQTKRDAALVMQPCTCRERVIQWQD